MMLRGSQKKIPSQLKLCTGSALNEGIILGPKGKLYHNWTYYYYFLKLQQSTPVRNNQWDHKELVTVNQAQWIVAWTIMKVGR